MYDLGLADLEGQRQATLFNLVVGRCLNYFCDIPELNACIVSAKMIKDHV